MRNRVPVLLALALGLCPAFAAAASPGPGPAELPPPATRAARLAAAERLARRPTPPPVPPDLASPFDPRGFAAPDAPEPAGPVAENTSGDRETLEVLAAQLSPSGVIVLRGSHLLILSNRHFEAGTRFTVSYQGREHELLLVSVTRTTFTLRYRGEEITRTIRSAR